MNLLKSASLYIVLLLSVIFAATLQSSPLKAQQEQAFIQIEAQKTLRDAQRRIQAYQNTISDLAGFHLKSGWYGIMIGPYNRNAAIAKQRQLRRDGLISRDSFITTKRAFSQQFWPIGQQSTQTPTPPVANTLKNSTDLEPQLEGQETRREAQASESLLTRDEKKDLQVALKWSGHYFSTIDGSFGRGTRRSMRNWQEDNGFETTGILTTAQRDILHNTYNAVLNGMDMRLIEDVTTGIDIKIPSGVVIFDRYSYPFAQFKSTTDLGAQVLLFSQKGNRNSLRALYDILQTLEVFPPQGERRLQRDSFQLTAQDQTYHSTASASLKNGVLKGYALIWPANDDARRTRVLEEMKASYKTTPSVMTQDQGDAQTRDSLDQIAGLKVRRAKFVQSGLYITQNGHVLTASSQLQSCSNITVDQAHNMTISAQFSDINLAVLSPKAPLSPMGVAQFSSTQPRLKAQIATAGYPYGGVLNAPSLTYGTLADTRGLDGNSDLNRLTLKASINKDTGGPVFDLSGHVIGVVQSTQSSGQQLPEQTSLSVTSHSVQNALSNTGLNITTSAKAPDITPAQLMQRASQITALISCW